MGTFARAAPWAYGSETLTWVPEHGPPTPTSGLQAGTLGRPVIGYEPLRLSPCSGDARRPYCLSVHVCWHE
jgi:hypothetical protein